MIYIRDVRQELGYDFLNKCKIDNTSFKNKLHNAYTDSVCKKKAFKEIVLKKGTTEIVVGYYIISMCNLSLPQDKENYDMFNYFSINLDLIYIHTPFRGHGIGKTVIKLIIREAKSISNATGCRFITLDALKDLENWYTNEGFSITTIEKNHSATTMMFYDFRNAKLYEEISNP